MAEKNGNISDIAANLSSVFRHFFPGVLVIGGMYLAYPNWFEGVRIGETGYLVVLGIVTITIGNLVFSINRYIVDQLIDRWFWTFCVESPNRNQDPSLGYERSIAKFAQRSISRDREKHSHAMEHIKFRSGSNYFLLTFAEVLIGFGVVCHKEKSFFGQHFSGVYGAGLLLVSVALICCTFWQMRITRCIDSLLVLPEQRLDDLRSDTTSQCD